MTMRVCGWGLSVELPTVIVSFAAPFANAMRWPAGATTEGRVGCRRIFTE